ncbi:MAG: ATP-dependent 6-phosphofructokinase [Bilifractor sp.]
MEEKKIKTIGVLTSGGDAPGMNAAVRAVVLEAIGHGMKVLGIFRGYSGLLSEQIRELGADDVAGIIGKGGTILETSRCPQMQTEEGLEQAAAVCRKYGIDGLVIVGGDGSFRGAQKLSKHGVKVIGVPGTIDGDIACTDYTIGFDTAANAAMEAIDRIRDTASSHECVSIVEVMGRKSGNLALWCAVADGAERVLIPEEKQVDTDTIAADILSRRKDGPKAYILVNAEGNGHTRELAEEIEKKTGVHTRYSVLSFLQRGGIPTCRERIFATLMGQRAVSLLAKGVTNRVVVHNPEGFSDVAIDEVLNKKAHFCSDVYEASQRIMRDCRILTETE